MKTKTFDCVEMKRKSAEAIRARLDGMTPEQELAYWSARTADFVRWQMDEREKASRTEPARIARA